jgi:hypothetical protein
MKTPTLKKILLAEVVIIGVVLFAGLGYLLLGLEQKPETISQDDFTKTPNLETGHNHPIETSTMTPMITPYAEREIYKFDRLNAMPQDDILEEIITFYGGGWGGPICYEDGLYFIGASPTSNWMAEIDIIACGWQPGELVEIAVFDENGISIYAEQQQANEEGAHNEGALHLFFWPGFNSTIGTLTIIFQGKHEALVHNVEIVMPAGPRFYGLLSRPYFILYNFSPQEKVRIAAYYMHDIEIATLIGWQEYQVDGSGQLIIEFENRNDRVLHIAFGEKSGILLESVHCYGCSTVPIFDPDGDGSFDDLLFPIP